MTFYLLTFPWPHGCFKIQSELQIHSNSLDHITSSFILGKISLSLFHFQNICSGLINICSDSPQERPSSSHCHLSGYYSWPLSALAYPSACWGFDVMWIICRNCGAFQLMQLHVCCGCSVVWLLALFSVCCPDDQRRKLSYAISYSHSSYLSLFGISSVILTSVSTEWDGYKAYSVQVQYVWHVFRLAGYGENHPSVVFITSKISTWLDYWHDC